MGRLNFSAKKIWLSYTVKTHLAAISVIIPPCYSGHLNRYVPNTVLKCFPTLLII